MSISIIPAIDLRDGRCVRLTQGRKGDTTIYDGNPIDIALRYEASGAENDSPGRSGWSVLRSRFEKSASASRVVSRLEFAAIWRRVAQS